ncbi:MFS transporter [Halalkalibacterium halodurans]|uniref:MDR family MFS transporter n=1 Tax=Halalkalibacterium halodurans TaxID=86665 RepID=UPI002E1B3911|nr:MFS transporter [Halalkalibacterium halodurans]MED4084392.1 MFS transporter [Halalkalibacterium halodurans]MED4103539.1 MFS transporter [Halalkalibacterium halodurans]MED4108804.1 MFS transporter [Halalkalibacterium halodurans]MED4126226.1 MFS transporter [Halalkalibacterium halodurans]
MRIRNRFTEFHPIVYSMIFGSVCMNIGFGMVVPYFAIYLGTYTGLDPVSIGLIVGTTSIGSLVGGFLGGTLSDQFGRKKIMLVSLVVASAIYAGFMLQDYALLLVCLTLVMGFCTSFFEPCAKALMADFTESKKRMKAFSLRYIGANIGFAIGPLIGIVAGVTASSRLPFIVVSTILLAYALFLQWLFRAFGVQEISIGEKEHVNLAGAFKAIQSDRVLLLFLFGGLLATVVHGQFSVILSQYFELEFQSGLAYLMLLWSVHSGVIVICGIPLVKVMERLSPLRAIVIGSLFFAVGVIGFAFSFNFMTFCLAMIVFTIGEMFLIPAEYSIVDEITPNHMRGTYYGSLNFTSLGSFIGPWLSGILLVHFGGKFMFIGLALICALSLFFFIAGHLKRRAYTVGEAVREAERGL